MDARALSAGLGAGLALDGAVLAVLAAVAPRGGPTTPLEAMLGLGVLIPGLMVIRAGERGVGTLPGELALDAALLSLGVAMAAYQAGGVAYSVAAGQFACVLVALFLGACALTLSAATRPAALRFGPISVVAALRDGLVLITGVVLLAIGLTQMALPELRPPRWSWISFLGITTPGMLVLILRAALMQAARRCRSGLGQGLSRGASRTLLVVGLTVMLYGGNANLVLGANGFRTGISGDAAGLAVWAAAAAAMLLSARRRLLVVGALGLILGERSVVSGHHPTLVLGGAAPEAALILLGGVLLLIIRPAADLRARLDG
ncbi:MAG: hypothetical protein JWM18_3927 [Chloroflexi bacterium]|jgi:hypothetical protein|nr:hypothetical protein [Chloroflexota bacterium]